MENKKAVGLDIGSQTTKVIVLDGDGILASSIIPSGDDAELSAKTALEQALQKVGLRFDDNLHITATGIGAKSALFSQQQKGTLKVWYDRMTPHRLLIKWRLFIRMKIGMKSSELGNR